MTWEAVALAVKKLLSANQACHVSSLATLRKKNTALRSLGHYFWELSCHLILVWGHRYAIVGRGRRLCHQSRGGNARDEGQAKCSTSAIRFSS
jgi:hypothetical protein